MTDLLKNVLNDRTKTAYIASFAVLGLFAYILIIKIDVGNLHRLNRAGLDLSHNLNTLKAISQHRACIAQFNSQLTADKEATSLVDIVSDAANKESIALSLVKPVETGIVSGYKKISVLAEGKARYRNIVRFVADLENNEKLIIIEEFGLISETGAEALGSNFLRRAKTRASPEDHRIAKEAEPSQGRETAAFKIIATCFGTEK